MTSAFDDGKDEAALRTIGEVSRALGIRTHVLRYWEQQFPMLRPLKRSGGRRYYRNADVELVRRIDRLVNREGYTLKGARAALRGKPGEAAADAGQVQSGGDPSAAARADSAILDELKSIRKRLASALDA